ncbi:Lipoprotein [Plantibacter sp. RU18]
MTVTGPRRTPRRLLTVLAASAGLALSLSACTTTGAAFPDPAVQRAYMQDLADSRFELLAAQIGQAPDVTGSAYVHAVSGDLESHRNDSVVLFGDPTGSFSQDKGSADGDTVDVYHQAGTSYDLLLLGGELKELAPTEWVAVQTQYTPAEDDAEDGSLGPACIYPGISIACDIYTAVESTRDSEEGALSSVVVSMRNYGSSQITTSASLDSVLALGTLFALPDDLVSSLSDEDLATLLPVTIFQNADGGLVKIELSGTVDSETPLQLQAGFEVTGTSTIEDLPTPPSGFDVTVIPAADQAAFWEQIEELRK